ncbi:hypothetical protein LguiA_014139 [Lonicera macranthoides]
MNKAMFGGVAVLALVVVVVLGQVAMMEAVTCNVMELAPCLQAFTSPAQPSAECCGKLKEQEPCLCNYIKDPTLGQYVNSPQAKKVEAGCRVPVPDCN